MVIGILFTVLNPNFRTAKSKAKETAIKNDFRAYSLAAEQMLREYAGGVPSKITAGEQDYAAVMRRINNYLDNELKFKAFASNTTNPFGEHYILRLFGYDKEMQRWDTGLMWDDGGSNAIVICAAKAPGFSDVTNIMPETHEIDILTDNDNGYFLVVTYVDGVIDTYTVGFSKNI